MPRPPRTAAISDPDTGGWTPFDAARSNVATRRRLSGPGLRTFLAICDLWGLSERDRQMLMGQPARSTYHRWTKSAREHQDLLLDVDQLTRISIVLGIHQALSDLHETEAEARAWLRTPNTTPVFGGLTPFDVLTSGSQDTMLTVRRFLEAAKSGPYMPPNDIDEGFTPYESDDVTIC